LFLCQSAAGTPVCVDFSRKRNYYDLYEGGQYMKLWWKSFTPAENTWYCWRLAGAEIFVRRSPGRWQSAVKSISWVNALELSAGPVEEAPAENLVTEYAVIPREGRSVSLKPFFGGKPFLIKLNGKLNLLPGAEAAITAGLPPSLKFESDREMIFSFNPFILSGAWYGGDTMNGKLCSSLAVETAAVHGGESWSQGTLPGPAETPAGSLPVYCTILVRNYSKAAADLDRMILYPGELSIHEKDGRLFCDTPIIDLPGDGPSQEIRPAGIKVLHHGKLLTAGAKNSMGGMLIRRGTKILGNIAGRS
jgi:hypothetical protein